MTIPSLLPCSSPDPLTHQGAGCCVAKGTDIPWRRSTHRRDPADWALSLLMASVAGAAVSDPPPRRGLWPSDHGAVTPEFQS